MPPLHPARGKSAASSARSAARSHELREGVGMKSILRKRSGLLLAAAMVAALAELGAARGSALAQTAGAQQQASTPWYKSALMGSSAPLINVSENPGLM